eukprot:5093103-Amphidinium_carterae.1
MSDEGTTCTPCMLPIKRQHVMQCQPQSCSNKEGPWATSSVAATGVVDFKASHRSIAKHVPPHMPPTVVVVAKQWRTNSWRQSTLHATCAAAVLYT